MQTTTILTKRMAAAAALLLSITGCDADDAHDFADGAGPVELRDDPFGPIKLNTNFLGIDGTLPLDAIPLVDDPGADVRLHAVWKKGCFNEVYGWMGGLFYTSDLDGELGIEVLDGELQPTVFRKYGNPSLTCTVSGAMWNDAVWGVISLDTEGKAHNNYLRIIKQGVDDRGLLAYRWGVLTDGADPWVVSNYTDTCVEDVEAFGPAVEFRFDSYLVADLAVDPATGDFSEAPDQFFIACRSGAVNKAMAWGYDPADVGTEVHELATRVVRADYCGGGKAYTKPGNKLQLADIYGINAIGDDTYLDEAAWDLATSRATCVTMPRDKKYQLDFDGIECGDEVLPFCDDDALDAATIRTKLGQ